MSQEAVESEQGRSYEDRFKAAAKELLVVIGWPKGVPCRVHEKTFEIAHLVPRELLAGHRVDPVVQGQMARVLMEGIPESYGAVPIGGTFECWIDREDWLTPSEDVMVWGSVKAAYLPHFPFSRFACWVAGLFITPKS